SPLPKMQIFTLMYISFGEPLAATVIDPFIVQLVRETGITGGIEARTGYYAGAIESLFYAAEGLTVLQWGRASDRIGRKPPLVFGTLGLAAAVTSFGFSNSYWPLIASRFMQGVFNGNIGITKCVLAESTDSTNIATALSFIPLQYGLGMTFGPMIGGLLAHPAKHWPNTLGKIALLREHPYLLPCATAALVPLSAFIWASIFLKETLPSAIARNKKKSQEGISLPPSEAQSEVDVALDEPKVPFSALMNRTVLIPVVNYAFLVFVEQCSSALLPLVYASSIEAGGLGLDSFTIGLLMSGVGIGIGLSATLISPGVLRKLGPHNTYRTFFWCYLFMILSYPTMNFLARRAGGVDIFVWIVMAAQLSIITLTVMNYTSMYIFFNNSAPTKSTLGAVNGLAQTVACFARILAPITSSSLFSLTQQYNLLGGTMVYWILVSFFLCGLYASSYLPKHLKEEE
ncbi:MFS general substrate transporter, partial [Athelia psychrophila]